MTNTYKFRPELFLRVPFYGYQKFDPAALPLVLAEPAFRNAIWLASPDFFELIRKKGFAFDSLTVKEQFTLMKYFNRICYRPTPFGSFASFSLLKWQDGSPVQLVRDEKVLLTLLPDLAHSSAAFGPNHPFTDQSLVRKSPSLYRLGEYYRYVHTAAGAENRYSFRIDQADAVAFNRSLVKLVDRGPVPAGEMVQWIKAKTQCPEHEARDYLRYLLEDQMLYAAGQGHIIAHSAEKYGMNGSFWKQWKQKPLQTVGDLWSSMHDLTGPFSAMQTSAGPYYYAATERPHLSGGPSPDEQKALLSAVAVLQKLALPLRTETLDKFIAGFRNRFDREKVPLLLALDPDAGISYGDSANAQADDWSADIRFQADDKDRRLLEWDGLRRVFLKIWLKDTQRGPYDPIILKADDLDHLPEPTEQVLPSSMSVIFRQGENRLIVEQVAGVSAVQLIARFSMFSDDAHQLAKQIAAHECAAHPEIIFADLGQLSDRHADNINRRKQIYPYEIPLNVYPQGRIEDLLELSDLLLSVRDGELILESVSRGKRVIPRLASAYNFRHNELPLFRFLCDLQFQGLQTNLGLDLERLYPGLKFYPRIEWNRTVISPARWLLDQNDIGLGSKQLYQAADLTGSMRKRHGLPAWVTLGGSDQQLIFNLEDQQQSLFFLQCIQHKKQIVLQEYLPPDPTISSGSGYLAGQYIAFLEHAAPVHKPLSAELHKRRGKTSRFVPGSDWLFVKLYCTKASANILIRSLIWPLVKTHKRRIRTWFFIRYADPGHHLRLRIRVTGDDAGQLLAAVRVGLGKSGLSALVSRLVCDTYHPELDRYGNNYIDQVESIFQAGSDLVTAFIGATESPAVNWEFQLAVYTAHQMIGLFYPDQGDAITFTAAVRDNLMIKLSSGKETQIDLDRKYRQYRNLIEQSVAAGDALLLSSTQKGAIRQLLALTRRLAANMLKEKAMTKNSMLADLVHMQLNRTFMQNQLRQELVVYYCLNKFLLGKKARS